MGCVHAAAAAARPAVGSAVTSQLAGAATGQLPGACVLCAPSTHCCLTAAVLAAGVAAEEQRESASFQPMPYYFMEIACILFDSCPACFGSEFTQVRVQNKNQRKAPTGGVQAQQGCVLAPSKHGSSTQHLSAPGTCVHLVCVAKDRTCCMCCWRGTFQNAL